MLTTVPDNLLVGPEIALSIHGRTMVFVRIRVFGTQLAT